MNKVVARHVPQQAKRELDAQIDRMERIEADEMADRLLLWEWGAWSRRTGDTLGYPACLLPFSAKGSWEKNLRRYIASINDDEAMRIDAAVAALPGMHRAVVIAVYRLGIETRRLPQVLQTSAHQIAAYRNQAIGILWQSLHVAQQPVRDRHA